MTFENISSIDINNKMSWENRCFLTFDIDWCSDKVLADTLIIIEENNIKATFFVTHKTELLHRMRKNKNIELGIHPNFNFLLNGDFRYGKNYEEVIEYYLNIVPEAISVRSHSLTQNSYILNAFTKFGLKYDSNHYIPLHSGINVKPWANWDYKLIKVPFVWSDDLHCLYNLKYDSLNIESYNAIKVFNFHPINLFLNLEQPSRYEQARDFFNEHNELIKHINKEEYGTKNFLLDLISSKYKVK